MGQHRRGPSVLAYNHANGLRLKAFAKSYKVEVKVSDRTVCRGDPSFWFEIQRIPRTVHQYDIPHERKSAMGMFRRRSHDFTLWKLKLGQPRFMQIVERVLWRKYRPVWLHIERVAQEYMSEIARAGMSHVSNGIGYRQSGKGWQLALMYNSGLAKNFVNQLHAYQYGAMTMRLPKVSGSPCPMRTVYSPGASVHDEVIYDGFELEPSKEGRAPKHSRRQRDADPERQRLWQKHHAYGRFRDTPDPERQRKQNDRARYHLRRNPDTTRFDWASLEGRTDIFLAGPVA
jgi:hypothetical protein